MRAAGIPARVATGYVGGYHNRYGDYWLVRRPDAHAWAEVWLEGRGGVRGDPTGAVAAESSYETPAQRATGTVGGGTDTKSVVEGQSVSDGGGYGGGRGIQKKTN